MHKITQTRDGIVTYRAYAHTVTERNRKLLGMGIPRRAISGFRLKGMFIKNGVMTLWEHSGNSKPPSSCPK